MPIALPLLQSKLFVPPTRPALVPRPRLLDRLNEGLHGKLTLIAAPAGFGKTTLVSEWVAGIDHPVAWLSLDEGDNDPTRFLTYLVAALQTIRATIGEGLLALLQSAQPPPTEAILTAVLNSVSTVPDSLVLVLDDYHVLDTPMIDHALAFLLEHLPPRMHLVIATREDPPFPLARLRARGQLTELRAADLRFTPAEAVEFLNQVMRLDLSEEDVAALDTRTEGWIAGLQLAALSMQGHQDIPGFIRAFAGDHRYVVDYLVEEVLRRQPEAVRDFLLRTAILDQLNGPLCDAVTGHADGIARLEALERGNFFLVPLDDRRHWYRYHHLFANVLHAQLMAEQPELVTTLHGRASVWYEQHGATADAIRHALAAEDFERAAELIEKEGPAVRRARQEALMLGWLTALPGALLRCRPVLQVAYAHVLLAGGERDGVEERLRDAERWLDTTEDSSGRLPTEETHPGAVMVVVDDEAFRRLPGMIAIARTGLALARGDVTGSVTYARRALDLAPGDDHQTRGAAAAFLGLASWASGDLEAAHRMYAGGMASLQKAGNISDAINGTITLAAIRMAQGRLRQAMRCYERGLELAEGQRPEGTPPGLRGTADLYVGMSEIHHERGDLTTATQYLLKSREMGEHMGFAQNRYRWRVAMARIRGAQGDLEGALDLLREAERLYMSDFSPDARPIAALVTRVWIAQGRVAEALDWAREQGLSAHDDLCYVREFEHITLARLLLARYKSGGAENTLLDVMTLLERLLEAAEEGQRIGSVIEILVLQALVQQARGNLPAALAPLERALALAEPEGYVRLFVDEGWPMAVLLEAALKKGIVPLYARLLLSAFEDAEDRPPVTQPLVDPLSERELEVLRLLGTDLSGPDLARHLMVSLNTIRTHTKNIYSKLGVNNRRAAVHRAEDLHLL